MKNLYILGTKNIDLFKLLTSINRTQPTWNIAGFVDIKKNFRGKAPFGYPFYAGEEKIKKLTQDANNYFFCNKPRNITAVKLLSSLNCNMATLIHPTTDLTFVKMGNGCVIDQSCTFGVFIKIGNFVTFRIGCQINHDTVIEDYVFVGPGANIGSNVVLKKKCFIGQGAIVMGGKVIGEDSVVGAGAVVTKDVPPGTVVAGVPAQPMEI